MSVIPGGPSFVVYFSLSLLIFRLVLLVSTSILELPVSPVLLACHQGVFDSGLKLL